MTIKVSFISICTNFVVIRKRTRFWWQLETSTSSSNAQFYRWISWKWGPVVEASQCRRRLHRCIHWFLRPCRYSTVSSAKTSRWHRCTNLHSAFWETRLHKHGAQALQMRSIEKKGGSTTCLSLSELDRQIISFFAWQNFFQTISSFSEN